jgi:signal transduction histidine kinase
MRARRASQPSFFWQGLLIVLPVVVLAGAGLFSLRQDQAMARREAVEKAQAFADQFADILWGELTESSSLIDFTNHTFRIDARGNLIDPPPAPPVPAPQAIDLSTFSDSQRRLWSSVLSDPIDPGARSNAIVAGQDLLKSALPQPVEALVQYRLGVLLEAAGDRADAAVAFDAVVSRHSNAVSEAGLPLAPLAEWRRLQLSSRADTNLLYAAESFCARLVERPSFLTPRLLEEVSLVQRRSPALAAFDANKWLDRWRNDNARRLLAKAALPEMKFPVLSNIPLVSSLFSNKTSVPKMFWFHAPDLHHEPQPVFPLALEANKSGQVRQHTGVNSISAPLPSFDDVLRTNPPSPGPAPDRAFPDRNLARYWLATRHDDASGNHQIVCRVMGSWHEAGEAGSFTSPSWTELRDALPKLPEWLGCSIQLAGETLMSAKELEEIVLTGSESKGSGPHWKKQRVTKAPEILASASRFEQGKEMVRVNLHLVAPQLLYHRQRTRSLLFGGLIAASALAAIVGFISARRAFLRQQQLSEMKSNFVSSVSHELRAPIASVRLLAESLERGKVGEPSKQHEYFRFIVQECRRLSSLIENVLDFARIEQGRKEYEFEPTDLPTLLRQTVKLMEPAAAEKQIELRLNLGAETNAADGFTVSVDASAIQQSVINLIDNALKHSPISATVDVALSVSAMVGAPNSDSARLERADDRAESEFGAPLPALEISITDHGPGIPATEHDKIFERFYRRGSELRRETQGVGIGLSIVKHIVEAHGGRVRVESEVGKGSRFVLELPVSGGMTNVQ